MTGNNENAVVYARYSSRGQQETSIEGQLAAAQKYAEAKGYTIIHEYCDRAKTGTNDNREAFQQMLHDCAKGQFTVIIVWKVDRFGRNREEITFNKYRAKKCGVRVEYVAENTGEGPESVILESVLEGMAEYYSLQLSQNVQRGLLEAAKKHHVVGGSTVPLGLAIGEDKTYVIDPETAPVVKLIFDMYAAGSTEAEIIKHLNAKGIRTRNGNEFKRTSLVRLLRNEKYIGVYTYKDIIREEDVIPAIIDKGVFKRVQEMLKLNKRMPSHRWSYTDYILTGRLFCGLCSSAMAGVSGTSKNGSKHSYYTCMKRWKEKACDKTNIRADVLEPLVLKAVFSILDDSGVMDYIAQKTWEFYQAQDAERLEEIALKKELESIEKGITNILRTIEAGIFNDILQKRMEELDGQRAAVKKALAEKELEREKGLSKEMILFALEQFRKMDRCSRDYQRRLIETFVNAIYLYDDRVAIAFNYTNDDGVVTVMDIGAIKNTSEQQVFERARVPVGVRVAFEPQLRLLRLFWVPGKRIFVMIFTFLILE